LIYNRLSNTRIYRRQTDTTDITKYSNSKIGLDLVVATSHWAAL